MLGEPRPGARAGAGASAGLSVDRRPPCPGSVARNLAGGRQLHDVSLEVRAGEVLGLAALEGQGQDLLFQMLSGDRSPTVGEIIVEGEVLQRPPSLRRHPSWRGPRTQRPDARAAAPAIHPREPGRPALQQDPGLGADPVEARDGRQIDRAVDQLSIDTRAASAGQPAVRAATSRSSPSARWLTGGFRTLLLFDPTRGHRHRHQAPDLRPHPRAGRWRSRRGDVHQRAARDRPGLRSGRCAAQRRGRRRTARPMPGSRPCSPPRTDCRWRHEQRRPADYGARPCPSPRVVLVRFRRRQGWVCRGRRSCSWCCSCGATRSCRTSAGSRWRTITAGTMTLAFLAMAQAVIVIGGGINLAIGARWCWPTALRPA